MSEAIPPDIYSPFHKRGRGNAVLDVSVVQTLQKFACMAHVDTINIVLCCAVLLIFNVAAHSSILQQT